MSVIDRILEVIKPQSKYLIPLWFPEGKFSGNKEYLIKNTTRNDIKLGSFSVNIDSGFAYDFATGEKYGLIDLFCIAHNLKKREAIRELAKTYLTDRKIIEKNHEITIREFDKSRIRHVKFGVPIEIYTYRDFDDNLIGYTCRFEEINEKYIQKYILPLTWFIENGKQRWTWSEKGWNNKKPIYFAEKIFKNPLKKILIVEGERTCDAAQRLLPNFICVSWRGGVYAAKKVDWTNLKERFVFIWPDNDACGIIAANAIKEKLNNAIIVAPPSWKEIAWDLKNAEEEKISGDKIEDYIYRFL